MRLEHLHAHQHLSRRDALGIGAAGVAVAGLASTITSGSAGAAPRPSTDQAAQDDGYDDEMFDVQAVLGGAWAPNLFYGGEDLRGTFNELTPKKAGEALDMLKRGRAVYSYQVGEEMFNGFPAFAATPPRRHDMFLYLLGYEPPAGFVEGGGIVGGTEPFGPNKATSNEERFGPNYTYQIGTQLDGLGHVGVGDVFYNGWRGADLATPTGLAALGNETMGPVITRGVIYDVVGLKVAQGKTDDLLTSWNGPPILAANYRITIDDLKACLDRQHVKGVGRGDVPLIHTGWTHLAHIDDTTRYLTSEPGIYLAEARWFADKRVALIASDSWGLEVIGNPVSAPNAFPCHQELLGKYGVRIGEGFVTDSAIAAGVYEGVLIITPQNTPGATAGSTPPVLLGQPGRKPRD